MLYAVVAVALFLVTFFITKERVVPQKSQQSTFKKDLGDILTNGPGLMLALIGIFTLGYVSIRNGSIMYYFKYYVKDSRTFLGLDTATWSHRQASRQEATLRDTDGDQRGPDHCVLPG